MSAININKNNFENEVLNSDKTVLLDFCPVICCVELFVESLLRV